MRCLVNLYIDKVNIKIWRKYVIRVWFEMKIFWLKFIYKDWLNKNKMVNVNDSGDEEEEREINIGN